VADMIISAAIKLLAFVPVLIASALPAFGCITDVDCRLDSRCFKEPRELYGVCAGGLRPGNRNDKYPVRNLRDVEGTVGNTCLVNADCGSTNRCLKSNPYGKGVCARRR
jgi:hypothetical protein